MRAADQHLIETTQSSILSLPIDNRESMVEHIQNRIKENKKEISELYIREEKKLYPLKYTFADTSKAVGIAKRNEAFAFVQLLAQGIKNAANQLKLINEIRDNIIRNEFDYVSALIEASSVLFPAEPNSKFSIDLQKIADDYYKQRGYDKNKLFEEVAERQEAIYHYEFMIEAIRNKDEYIVFPKQLTEMPEGENKLKLAPFAMKSMVYLNSRA